MQTVADMRGVGVKNREKIAVLPKNLKKVQIYPNLVITLLEVNSLTLHNLHYTVFALCKAARPAQIKEKIKILVL